MYSGELPWKTLRNVIFAFCEEGLLLAEADACACAEAMLTPEPIVRSKLNAANNRFMAKAAPAGKMAHGSGAAGARGRAASGRLVARSLREYQTGRGTVRSADGKALPRARRRHRPVREFPPASAAIAPSAEAAACRRDRNRRWRP